MIDPNVYGEFVTSWCPGCGNHDVLAAVKEALARQDLEPHRVAMVSGIGQAAKIVHYLKCNGFNGLHGRALPAAQALKLTNPELAVLVESGDGCTYGEGGNHFLAAIRRNVDVTLIVHDNQIYGLTKGQSSPTTMAGQVTKNNPLGVMDQPFNPVAVAVAMRAGFVARTFSGLREHVVSTIMQAMKYPGFALVDLHSPCISFNKVNTFAWYKSRCREVGHDPSDWLAAMGAAAAWGDEIPIGVLYREDRTPKDKLLPQCADGPLWKRSVDRDAVRELIQSHA
jgi:2-oxoglutarate ferredoxin oxidoreductase subunit beta